jgi:hypothetical protein
MMGTGHYYFDEMRSSFFIPSSIDIGPYIIVSISLTNSLFSPETVKYSNIIAWKKVFLNERCLEPTTADINYIAKAPRFSHHDCGVIEQKLWFESSL